MAEDDGKKVTDKKTLKALKKQREWDELKAKQAANVKETQGRRHGVKYKRW